MKTRYLLLLVMALAAMTFSVLSGLPSGEVSDSRPPAQVRLAQMKLADEARLHNFARR